MYSILVNPTHAVTGALAPSSPFCGFIFSFSRDLIFFSFSLFLTPLWLSHWRSATYLIDFASPMPRFQGSPWAHILVPSPTGLWAPSFPIKPATPLPLPLPKYALSFHFLQLSAVQPWPATDFHLWNRRGGSAKTGGPCVGQVVLARKSPHFLGNMSPIVVPLLSPSFSGNLHLGAAHVP